MNKDEKNIYNQTAWILNYNPTIHHQHIHTPKGIIDIDLTDEKEKKEDPKDQGDFYDFEEILESGIEEAVKREAKQQVKPELPPADVFVNQVKAIIKEAAKKNGEIIPAKPRGQANAYTFFVDAVRIVRMMDELRNNHEDKINDFLRYCTKYDGVMIVAPFIGRLLQMDDLKARDLQLSDLEFAFAPFYNNASSAVKRLSMKLNYAEANVLFSLLEGLKKRL